MRNFDDLMGIWYNIVDAFIILSFAFAMGMGYLICKAF